MPDTYNSVYYLDDEESEYEPFTANSKKSYATNIITTPQQQPLTNLLSDTQLGKLPAPPPPYYSPQHQPVAKSIALDANKEPLILSSQNFRVSLTGEEGPESFRDIAGAADNLTGWYDDSRYLHYQRDIIYGGGGAYKPIEFGVPNYTGDQGYPIVDPNPGNCRPDFLKDQFGRCIHISWFNLPPAPSQNPVWGSGEGSSPINGVCPPNMFLANNNRCYSYPDPPNYLPPPPPPPTTSGNGNVSGAGSSYVRALVNPKGRKYNSYYTVITDVGGLRVNPNPKYPKTDPESMTCSIKKVYIDKQNVNAGDRVTIDTTVQLYQRNSAYHVRVIIPDIEFKTASRRIPVQYPGVIETIETDFVVPEDTVEGEYKGQIQLWNGQQFKDMTNFYLNIYQDYEYDHVYVDE